MFRIETSEQETSFAVVPNHKTHIPYINAVRARNLEDHLRCTIHIGLDIPVNIFAVNYRRAKFA